MLDGVSEHANSSSLSLTVGKHITILSALAFGHHQNRSHSCCLVRIDRKKTFGVALRSGEGTVGVKV